MSGVGLLAAALVGLIVLPAAIRIGFGSFRVVVWLVWLVRWLCATGVRRQRIGQTRRIRYRWPRTAESMGLIEVKERTKRDGTTDRKTIVPKITTAPEHWGVRVQLGTLPRLGATEYDRCANWLADAWGARQVEVERLLPGRVELRAVFGDPLAEHRPFPWPHPTDKWALPIGHNPWGIPVEIPLRNLSGIKVAGLAGFGKTQLLLAWAASLGARPETQLAIFDGKTRDPEMGDWAGFNRRAMFLVGDNPDDANTRLGELVELVKSRPELLRAERGTHKFWDDGPTTDNPLVVVILDEAHNYVDTAGLRGDAKAVIEANQRACRTLAKEGRGLGVLLVPATQKGTADALPTAIRDNLEVGVCFAVATPEAAEAVLTSGIRADEANDPRRLRDKARYTGVCVVTGVPGLDGRFDRVRVGDIDPYVLAGIVADANDNRRDLAVLMSGVRRLGVVA